MKNFSLYEVTRTAERDTLMAAVEAAGGMCKLEHDGYACTMPLNHEGDHQARGMTSVCHRWANVPLIKH